MTSIRLGNNLVYRDGNIHQLSGRPGDSASSGNIIRKASADQIAQFGSAGRGAGGGTSFINASDFTAQAAPAAPAAPAAQVAQTQSSIQQPIDARFQNLLSQAGQQAINPTLPTGAAVKGIQIEGIQPQELQTAPLIDAPQQVTQQTIDPDAFVSDIPLE